VPPRSAQAQAQCSGHRWLRHIISRGPKQHMPCSPPSTAPPLTPSIPFPLSQTAILLFFAVVTSPLGVINLLILLATRLPIAAAR
jgi:hypothetical protein